MMFITNVTSDLCEGLIGKISGSGHGHQVLQISWIHSDGGQLPAVSGRTGSGYL
jgi:hypothetical protein